MSKPVVRRHETRTVEPRLEFDAVTLRRALMAAHPEIPETARITVRVPGGGDWSHTDLEVGGTDGPLVVSWTTREETET